MKEITLPRFLMYVFSYVRVIWELVLDIIAPPDPEIRRVETIDSYTFIKESMLSEAPFTIEGITHIFPYRNKTVKTALVEMKNHKNKKVAALIGGLAFDFLKERTTHLDNPLVLPIPITKKKRRERGWNQCDLIVEAIAHKDAEKRFEVRLDVLVKTRETADQVGKNRQERFINLRDSFGIKKPECVAGRNVIVLDDILTTGSTLLEAKRVLTESGAASVLCLAIAH